MEPSALLPWAALCKPTVEEITRLKHQELNSRFKRCLVASNKILSVTTWNLVKMDKMDSYISKNSKFHYFSVPEPFFILF